MKANWNKNIEVLICASALGSVTTFLAFIVIQSMNTAINIPTFHLDGAFQTASGLFRLDSGHAPGRDFFPYLGVGPLLLIFPFFKVAGGTLSASVFAAQFITLALGWIAMSVLFQLTFRPRMLMLSFAGGAALFILTFLITNQLSTPNAFAFAFEPGNSLRPIRAAAPYLVAIFSYLLVTRSKNGLRRNILAGLFIGVTLLWSNDFAVPTAGLFSIFYYGFLYSEEKSTWKVNAIVFSFVAFSSWILLLTIVTAGHPLELAKYNFVDVGKDQWWYFGPYGPTTRVFEFSQLPRIVSKENYFPLLVLLLAIGVSIKTKKIEHILISWIGLSLFAGGTLASLGGHIGGYFVGFYYWGVVTTVLALLRINQIYLMKKIRSTGQLITVAESRLMIFLFLVLLAGAANKGTEYQNNLEKAKNDADRFYVPEFDGYLETQWRSYIDYIRQHNDKVVIEDYWGIWNSLNRKFPSWPVDSVIHALGSVRHNAKLALSDADLIISTRYVTSPEWQPWNLSQNFWFYDELLSNWEPDFVSPTTIVWRKTDKTREYKNIDCQIINKNSFSLITSAGGFYKVTLSYSPIGPGRYLIMLNNNISFGADAAGYVSLPPGSSTVTIPVLITQESGTVFDSKIVGSNETSLKIETCMAKEITYKNDEILYVRSPQEFYLTDKNWVHGISRRKPRFFVPNNIPNQAKYSIGKYVYFKNRDFRKITDISAFMQYLNIEVDGPVLNPDEVGLPMEFQVFDTTQASMQAVSENFYLTDENWDHGVARAWTGFFVPNTHYYSTNFRVNNHVRLLNGEIRKIAKVEADGEYLEIHIEGEILNPEKSGLPSSFVIVEK